MAWAHRNASPIKCRLIVADSRNEAIKGWCEQPGDPSPHVVCAAVKREKDRWWEVRDPQNELMCMTVYERGAVEIVHRLAT